MNSIADLAGIAHRLIGLPEALIIGWVLHFGVGIGAWVLMMVIFQPMAGQGLFGLNGGMVVPVLAFMLHLVYGAVLGLVFRKLSNR